jgi:hypothetical protein
MSLLLEALKKAEKAKEEASRRAREERPAGEPEELHGEGAAPAEAFAAEPETPAPGLSRDKLPEISQKLEILSDDLDRPDEKPEPALAPVEPPRESKTGPRSAPPRDEAREEAGRASAR